MPTQLSFADKIYKVLAQVPRGRVTTYKALAYQVGSRAYRAVGQALKNNPYAPKVPCHRVVASDGKIGGFMGNKSGETVERKMAMLKNEGVEVINGVVVNFKEKLFLFSRDIKRTEPR